MGPARARVGDHRRSGRAARGGTRELVEVEETVEKEVVEDEEE